MIGDSSNRVTALSHLLTPDRALGRREAVTTGLAVLISSGLYLRDGPPYLAWGVVGDTVGLALLTGALLARRGRLRHEALPCLGAIGLTLALQPRWPLRLPSRFWWVVVAGELLGYTMVRGRLLPTCRLIRSI